MNRVYSWSSFGKKLLDRVDRPHAVGFFTVRQAEEKEMRLVTGNGANISFY